MVENSKDQNLSSGEASANDVRSLDLTQLYDPNLHLPSAPTDWTGYEPATPVSDELTARIAVMRRPISTADFMDVALLHPEFGYYSRAKTAKKKDDFDDDEEEPGDSEANKESNILYGDFLTSPEITSLFGESLGVWFLTYMEHQKLGKEPYQLLECGPGPGQLMIDWLRSCFLKQAPKADQFVQQSRELRIKPS